MFFYNQKKVVEYKINNKEDESKGYVRYYLAPKIEDAES